MSDQQTEPEDVHLRLIPSADWQSNAVVNW